MKKFFIQLKARSFLILLILLLTLVHHQANAQVGAWTAVKNKAPQPSGGLMLLLSDGTVMAKSNAGGGSGNVWMKLTPDQYGSYINGTWSTLASMINDRLYFSSQVLKDGRVYVAGGEYGNGGSLAEVYNPLNNTWTATPNPGHRISDANSEILPDGRLLQALVESDLRPTIIYDPVSNTYSPGPSTNGIHNESVWVKLPDNSILYVDRLSRNSERYIPSQNRWIVHASLPVDLYDPYGDETGAAFLLPDGRAFFIGSSGTTAYYTPSGNTNPGRWSAGPATPNGYGAPDGAAAMMVNGTILCVLSPPPTSANHFHSPTYFYEFDYRTNTFTSITAPNGSTSENHATFITNMLDLPDGTVLYSSQSSSQYYVYTPAGSVVTKGKPVISQVTANNCSGSSYTITGTGFNGISEGASYGDDWQMNTNYPIIRLTNGSKVYYARTFNWNNTGVQTGNTVTSTQFTLPVGLPYATYTLVVTANGISSDPISFTPSTCQGPVASITSPANNASFTAPATITINATATDQGATISKVDFYHGTTLIGTSTTSPYSYTWTNVTAGNYSLTAKATDNNGVVGTSSIVNITVNGVANQPPTVSITSPANNATFNAPASITISAAASDADGTISKVDFYNGTTLLGTSTTSPYSFNWNNVVAGTYSLTAKATDNSGAVTGSTSVSITVNSTSGCSAPAWNASTIYLGDAGLGTGKGEVVSYNGRQYRAKWWTQNNVPSSGGPWLDLGACTSNNQSPTVSITSPSNDATFNAPASITISAAASDADGTISKVDFYNGATLLATDNTTPYSFSWTSVAAGTYSLTAKATDNSGAVTTSAVVLITVNDLVNQAPTISITSPANNATFNAPASITISAAASDADGTISKVDFYNGATLLATDNTTPYSFSWSGVAAGTYSLTAKATDNSGAVTTSSVVNITVNTGSTCTAELWNATTAYIGGDQVQYGGVRYLANWWNQNKRPDLNNGGSGSGQPWTSLGTCNTKMAASEIEVLDSKLLIYPNPASSELTINLDAAEIEKIQIIGADGFVFLTSSNTSELNISSLPSGLYLIKIQSQGITLTRKITKQ